MNGKLRNGPPGSPGVLRTIGLGLLVLTVGLGLALALLPEWDTGKLRPERFYVHRFGEVAQRLDLRLEPGRPKVRLAHWQGRTRLIQKELGERGDEWLAANGSAGLVEVLHPVVRPDGERAVLAVFAAPTGDIWQIHLMPRSLWALRQAPQADASRRLLDTMAPLLLGPGEWLGETRVLLPHSHFQNITWCFYPVDGKGRGRDYLIGPCGGSPAASLSRAPGDLRSWDSATLARHTHMNQVFGWEMGVAFLLLLAGAALWLALLARRQLGVATGAALAAAGLLTFDPRAAWASFFPILGWLIGLASIAAAFFLWSAGESLLRSRSLSFTTSLDSLRAGRLGPRGGRALLAGFGWGAGLAGLQLLLAAGAVVLPGVSPAETAPPLPILRVDGGPMVQGVLFAAAAAVAVALTSRYLPPRWVPWGATLLALWFAPAYLLPTWVSVLAKAALAGVLVQVLLRHGLTALLAAGLVATLLPAALWSALHLPFLAGSFAVTAMPVAAVVLLGAAGLRRPAEAEAAARPPRFVRRLEEQRRLRYETGLLARMQEGLIPRQLPELPGYELAARFVPAGGTGGNLYDVLPDGGGGFWVASADVSGQGKANSIAQAMIKAALHSLVAPGVNPAEVLRQINEVLRGIDPQRNLASLALVRITGETGECRLANAAHPPPLVAGADGVVEIAGANPPLGEEPGGDGVPPREPRPDAVFTLAPGDALVLASEPLFDETNRKGVPFGLDNVRGALLRSRGEPAGQILETLLGSWRRHLGGGQPADDTTVLVVRRAPREEA